MRVFINSKFRSSGTSDDFKILLNNPLVGYNIIVGSVVIPKTYNNILDGINNRVKFLNSAFVVIDGSLPVGTAPYQLSFLFNNLITFLQFNDPGRTYTIVLDDNNKVVISIDAGGFGIFPTPDSIFYLLGFRENVSGSSIRATHTFDIERTKQIIIESSFDIGSPNYRTGYNLSTVTNGFHILKVLSLSNDELHSNYSPTILNSMPIIANNNTNVNVIPFMLDSKNYSNLSFRLLDDQGRPLDLNGFDWNIELILNIDFNGKVYDKYIL
jgi:hypothetical protein